MNETRIKQLQDAMKPKNSDESAPNLLAKKLTQKKN